MKWQFYAVAAEEFMTYLDEDETSAAFSEMQGIVTDHQPCPIPKDFAKKYPYFIICSMEESIRNKVLATMKTKGRQKWARRRAHLVYCASPMCKITAHTCAPDETKLGMMPRFLGMSCFKIAHTPEANNLFTCIGRKGKEHLNSIPFHTIFKEYVHTYQEVNTSYTQKCPR